jgi:hypothetical protein
MNPHVTRGNFVICWTQRGNYYNGSQMRRLLRKKRHKRNKRELIIGSYGGRKAEEVAQAREVASATFKPRLLILSRNYRLVLVVITSLHTHMTSSIVLAHTL